MAADILPFPSRGANDDDPDRLPPNPGAALMLAFLYRQLGCEFTIGANGEKRLSRPEAAAYTLTNRPFPQIRSAQPWEQFHCGREWEGAIKLLELLLRRLDREDTAFIYHALADVEVDERKLPTSINEPMRKAA